MTSQKDIELEMRLCAFEYTVSKLSLWMATSIAPLSDVEKNLNEFAQTAAEAHKTFPGLDPVQSDMASDEWKIAIDRLVGMQKEMWAEVRKQGKF